MPFLNGILLATEENHTATVLWSWSALIRRCYMLPSLHRPDPFVSCCAPPALHCTFTCRSLCASCQRPILPILRHHPPCHPRPTLLSISTARYTPYLPTKQHHLHTHTQTHTHIHARKRSRPHLFLFPVPNYGKAKSASAVISPLPLAHSPVGRSTQPAQLYKTREAPGRGVCSATLLCMKTRTSRTTPNPSFAADHTQAPILAIQPFPAPICFSTPAHLAQH